ncbi:cupin domain-containing protein [Pseudophaeobacter sp.]|uniref:cupin domain-containing protein n=1 Tax=Pseudophaeobacter sp. TaxID=1971739 RepID=UPI0032967F39
MGTNDILDEMEIRVDPFALCELTGACDLGMEKDAAATLHYVLAGQGELLIPEQVPVPVSHGSLILVSAFSTHAFCSFGALVDPFPSCKPDRLNLAHLIHQSSGESEGQLLVICARMKLTLRQMQNLVDLIRAPVVENQTEDRCLVFQIERFLCELSVSSIGSEARVRALVMQCSPNIGVSCDALPFCLWREYLLEGDEGGFLRRVGLRFRVSLWFGWFWDPEG